MSSVLLVLMSTVVLMTNGQLESQIPPPPISPPVATSPFPPTQCPQENGFFAQGDGTWFIQCINGTSYPFRCQPDLVFDERLVRCDWRGASTQASTPSTLTTTTQMPVTFPAADCPEFNGFFAQGDGTWFIQCVNGTAYPFNCPERLVFNEATVRCDWPYFGTTVTPPSAGTTTSPTATTTSEKQIPAPTFPPTKCPELYGFFAQGDGSWFIRCVGGIAYPNACPAGLVFDNKLSICNWP